MICDETGNGKPTQRHEVTRSIGVRAQNRSSPDTGGGGAGEDWRHPGPEQELTGAARGTGALLQPGLQ